MYYITKTFRFEASHKLWDENLSLKDNNRIFGKCTNLHGHSYKIKLYIKSGNTKNGMVMNFTEVKEIFMETIYNKLDHKFLNEVVSFLTTAENLAEFIYYELKSEIDKLYKVEVWETETSSASYETP